MTANDRPNPPALIWQAPICPMCKDETTREWGDCWVCEPCDATWDDTPNAPGDWIDWNERQCESTVDASNTGGGTYRCLKGESHVDSADPDRREHHGEGSSWPNSWLPEIKPALTRAEREARDAAVLP